MDDYLQLTPISVSIHRQSENPIFGKDGGKGEGILHVSLDSDGGMQFLVIKQLEDEPDPGVIRIEAMELSYLLQAAQQLGLITERSTWLIEVATSEETNG